jgi:hypothetical protein
VEVATETELRQLKFTRAEDLARTANRVVGRLVEAVGEVGVDAKLSGEGLRLERRFLGSGIPREPREVAERKRLRLRSRRWCRRIFLCGRQGRETGDESERGEWRANGDPSFNTGYEPSPKDRLKAG